MIYRTLLLPEHVFRVFRLVSDLETKTSNDDNCGDIDQRRLKMECVGRWELFGWIQSLASPR